MAKVAVLIDFKFGSAGAETTQVDYSTKFKTVDFPREQDLQDVTPFGSSAKQFAVGLSNATFKGEAFYDTTIEPILAGMIGNLTAIAFTFGPDGTTTGNPKYTGNMFVKSVGSPVKVGEVKMLPVDFQITGSITRTTY